MCMPADRVSSYLNRDGEDATIDELSYVLGPAVVYIVFAHVNIYDSSDMKVGINIELLKKAHMQDMLHGFLRIDPRGGHFQQTHMDKALRNAMTETEKNDLASKTAEQGKSIDDIIGILAYKIRVMLAHVRRAYDDHIPTGEPHPLNRLFDILRKPSGSTPTSRHVKRDMRLGNRQNPFMNFIAKRPAGLLAASFLVGS